MGYDCRPVLNDFIIICSAAHTSQEVCHKIHLTGIQRSPTGVKIIQHLIVIEVDFNKLSAENPCQHQIGGSFFNDDNFFVEPESLQQFAQRIN